MLESRSWVPRNLREASEAEWNKEKGRCQDVGARSRVLGLLQEPWFDSVMKEELQEQ